ncbi:MAG: hypothetical protein A3J65_00075 [Candidatus Buchananbacteria bacterium RIFCSPHIGHO2_02_FULL_45_11b]|uniref:Type II secretion system protein GspF domain-containing protein n=3 Tax=Candidatus Buchananiibacteriota TaxID=1817903 RepID=A0A1G1YDJ7_9BACT|nr:MAG: hypothetical protein A2663_04200 [Candidatus Buchananbacteria bacterium RIFCSPHIGHO2_01_FULL_46_12]OGY50331.1 MAG: hypothetical protein A3J65_00075 [Candidatus Buchananbacteria bacterium RIFCSPHIGHO2_02_FULL_45_11b]OGY57463.1 MAG: hypothetical protein A3H67_02310 [Candidatus Buchananbacteria bacterium RIFCSPLOWO2_02_FULL_46_11b]
MPYFRYKVADKNNQIVEAMIQAASLEVAGETLSDQGLTILSLKEEKISFLESSLDFLNRVKTRDLVFFCRQLSVIVSANVPLVQGLRILTNQTESTTLKSIISEVADDVDGGAKLSAALGRHVGVFSDFFINIIRSGETSGKLEEVLGYLADQMEKDYDLISRIRGAMIYPGFIIAGLGLVGAFMMISVVPQLTGALKESGVQLPLATKILIAVSEFLANFWWLALLALIGLGIGFRLLIKTGPGRRQWDNFKLKAPIFGALAQKIILVRFTRSLHTLIAGQIALTKSLNIAADVVGNMVFRDLILKTAAEVEAGNSIATVFLQSKEMPVMVSQMLNLGEKTGRLEDILEKLSGFYDREVNNMVQNLVTLIEPLVIAVMGVAVGVLFAAVILPMYSLALGM